MLQNRMPTPNALRFSNTVADATKTTETSSGQHVIMPNRHPSTRTPYIVLVEVNSRDRNFNNQIASNPLRFQFARPLKDIRTVELISGTIPAYPYCLNNENNKFTFQEGTASWTVTLPVGSYMASTLLIILSNALNALPGIQNTYTIDYNMCTKPGNLYIKATNSGTVLDYSFLFLSGYYQDSIDRSDGYLLRTNTPALLYGFDISDYYSNPDGTLTSPYPIDPVTALTRLYLYIDFDNSQNLGCIERGAGRRQPFAIIYLDDHSNGYKFLNKDTLTPASYSLPQPYARLQTMNIEFRDEFFRLVNFNGKEFSLLLQLTLLE